MIKNRKIFPGIIAYYGFYEEPMEIFNGVEEDGGWHAAETGSYGNGPSVIEEKRKGWMHVLKNLKKEKKIEKFVTEAIQHYRSVYGVDVKKMEGWCLLKYDEGDFFVAHTDDSHEFPRNISMVYYGNDDYIGGEIEFIYFNNLKIKPKAGELLIFPSSYIYIHQVNKIISGQKYAATSFAY
jgi:predicted 2-oxoglutarate/Fe(II)-dependent dioxygenase YbiX